MEIPSEAKALFEEAQACRAFERFHAAEVSVATPGHCVNGLDPFTQPTSGPFMLRLFRAGRSAYLWPNEAGQWFLRPWMKQEQHDDGTIKEITSLEDGLKQLEQNKTSEHISEGRERPSENAQR
ncbi:MAG: hypothetical protein HN341_14540 [Verrucomicrobia bacterium]|jgi:hypothetical protein|nr:hypothetical protein [Verrucomicrobiota bacterium]